MRSAVGAVAAFVGQLWVLPLIVLHLPSPWNDRISSVLVPSSPEWAMFWMAAYVMGSLGAASLVIARRDA